MDLVNIYQIFYDEASLNNCFIDRRVTLYYNDLTPEPYYENTLIAKIVPNHEGSEYLGVFSHKFSKKIGFNLDSIKYDSDVITFFSQHKHTNFLKNMERWHPNSKEALTLIMDELGVKIPDNLTTIYQNHFLAKTSIYKDYVNNWLIPIIKIMDNADGRLQEILSQSIRNGQYIGYQLHTFILERVFSIYCAVNKLKVKQLNKLR